MIWVGLYYKPKNARVTFEKLKYERGRKNNSRMTGIETLCHSIILWYCLVHYRSQIIIANITSFTTFTAPVH